MIPTPNESGVELVGIVGEDLWPILRDLTTSPQVYAVAATWLHIGSRHETQFSVDIGRALLPGVLAAPVIVYQARKPGSILFAGDFDADHYLVVPIKVLPNEMWLESMFLDRRSRLHTRIASRKLFFRKE